jgi:hypothetical protein
MAYIDRRRQAKLDIASAYFSDLSVISDGSGTIRSEGGRRADTSI